MRKVKCQICGKFIEQSEAFAVKVGNANKYYCSEEEYENWQAEKAKSADIFGRICAVYQYVTESLEPAYTLIRKELSDNLKNIPIETILLFVEENRERLKLTVEKKVARDGEFASLYHITRYISGIIKREIVDNDWKSKHKNNAPITPKKPGDMTIYQERNVPYISKRRPLSELIEGLEDDD